MCATFQLAEHDVEEIRHIIKEVDAKYGEGSAQNCISRDYFPKQEIPVVGPGNKVSLLRWGFPMTGSKQVVFNARAESLSTKPMFRTCLDHRCLIPATFFYEFGADKTKYKVVFEAMPFFYMAGLWKREISSEGSKLFYVTIITTAANKVIGRVHNRMPAIVTAENSQAWLNGGTLDILQPTEIETALIPA